VRQREIEHFSKNDLSVICSSRKTIRNTDITERARKRARIALVADGS
jgi:hypothetical protein